MQIFHFITDKVDTRIRKVVMCRKKKKEKKGFYLMETYKIYWCVKYISHSTSLLQISLKLFALPMDFRTSFFSYFSNLLLSKTNDETRSVGELELEICALNSNEGVNFDMFHVFTEPPFFS